MILGLAWAALAALLVKAGSLLGPLNPYRAKKKEPKP